MTPAYEPTTHGADVSDPTAAAALRQLPEVEDRIVRAVDKAIEETLRCSDGQEVMRLVTMIYFRRSHTLTGAAMASYMSEKTAKRRVNRFIYCVAKHAGYTAEAAIKVQNGPSWP